MKLGKEELEYMGLVERMTKARIKDCVVNDGELIFIVQEGDIGLAIGKNGENAERVSNAVGKKVSFIEYSPDKDKFMRKLFAPAVLEDIQFEGETATIKARESQRVIGKGGKRKKRAETLLERHFGIKSIIVAGG